MKLERVRNLREDRDLRQNDVAEYLRCTQVCYSRYESGTREIPIGILIKLALFYDTSTDFILGITDEKRPYKRQGSYAKM